MTKSFLRKRGDDLVLSITLTEDQIGKAGLNVRASVLNSVDNPADSRYWVESPTNTFSSLTEVFFEVDGITNGLYEATLFGAASDLEKEYRIHIQAGTTSGGNDFVDTTFVEEFTVNSDILALDGDFNNAKTFNNAMEGTVVGRVHSVPTASNTLMVKELGNDADADLNQVDILKNRVITFISGALRGQSVGITVSAAAASDPITLTVTPIANFSNLAVDDVFVIT